MTEFAAEALAAPPFTVGSVQSPAVVADQIVACFEALTGRHDRAVFAHSLVMSSLGVGDADPLLRAGAEIARQLDAGIGAGVQHGYHNTRHFIETMLCALYLARTSGLNFPRICRVVTAALSHDMHHDGSRGAGSRFRLETISAAYAANQLMLAGGSAEQCEQIRSLILATEPSQGVGYARACLWMHQGSGSMPDSRELPPELLALSLDPELAFDAVLLTEADVLPSVGLTVAHALQIQLRLGAEWKAPLTTQEKIGFIDSTRDAILVAKFFLPNVDAIRAACLTG